MPATKALLITLLAAAAGQAQVLAPEEIRDAQLRGLQQKYRTELKAIAGAAAVRDLPYHFYFSRKLDLEEKDQKSGDQRSIQFDRYQGRIVLKITGNYFASYSADLIQPEERSRLTYESVMLPLLRAAVHALDNADVPQAFAFEISHHVRRKVLGVSSETVENVVLVLPKASAQRLVSSTDPLIQRAAVLEGEAYLNAAPISFWQRAERAAVTAAPQTPPAPKAEAKPVEAPLPPPARDSSAEASKDLQKSYQSSLDRMIRELESQAHFIRYAPPVFIGFRNGVYLQLSMTTTLPEPGAASQYRLAALAFDQHIAHLIRPIAAYFKDRRDFDGIDFSTTVRLASGRDEGGSSLAVEFIFPLKLLSAYADFDFTGQQLIDGSYVLLNGERASLNLQLAEAVPSVR